jgi:uncharacterized protein (TIGR00255 family)
MIKSMTAYAGVEKTDGNRIVSAEMRSFNGRFLDILLRIPQNLQPLEERIKKRIAEKTSRGRIELKLQIQSSAETTCVFDVDSARAEGYFNALTRLKEQFGFDTAITLEHLSHLTGVIKLSENQTDTEDFWPLIQGCLDEALKALENMRRSEGTFIAEDFEKRLTEIESSVDRIESASEGLLAHYQERLKTRIAALTQGTAEIDPVRIAQEAAFLADRSDISEEIVRIRSHVRQFRTMMASDEPAGRKLNFLLQEFNREFNTLGAKTGSTEVSHWVVEIKSEIEKLREQVQNVE